VNGFAMAALAERDDPEAERAKALMPPVAFSRTAPWWGIVERSWASALHIGFTLVVAAAPLAVVVTAPLHSGINLGFLQLLRRWSIGAVSAAGIVVASVVTTVGFLLHCEETRADRDHCNLWKTPSSLVFAIWPASCSLRTSSP